MSAGAIEAGKAFVRIFADDLGLKAALQRTSAMLKSWAVATSAAGLGLIGVGTSLLAPLLVAGKQAAAYGDGLNDAASRTGIAVAQLVELSHAADLSGTNIESLQRFIAMMQKTIFGATKGVKENTDALAELGLTIGDLTGLSPDEQFKLIADRITQIQDPARKTAAALKIFGKGAAELLPLLNEGADGISRMQAEADRLGITLAGKMAASVGDVDDLLTTLTTQLHAFKTVVGAAVADSLRPFITATQPIIAGDIQWIASNRGLVSTLLLVGAGAIAAGGLLVTAGVSATVLLVAIGNLVTIAVAAGGAIATAFGVLMSPIGLAVAAVVAGAGAFLYFSGYGAAVLQSLGASFFALKANAINAWGGIVDAIGAGDFALAGKIALLALELAWLETVGRLSVKWSEFKAEFLTVTNGMFAGMVIAFAFATAEIERLWGQTTRAVSKGWDIANIGIAGLTGAITGDKNALGAAIGKTIANDVNRDVAANVDEERIRNELSDKITRAIGGAVGGAFGQGLNAGNANAGLEEKLRKAREELEAARERARQERQAAGEAKAPGKPKIDLEALNAAKGGAARGILSGFNLASLNVSPYAGTMKALAERTAAATERIADNTDDIDTGDVDFS